MEWHEVVAWVIIAAAFIVAVVWCIKRIICPTSRCEHCDKKCAFKRKSDI